MVKMPLVNIALYCSKAERVPGGVTIVILSMIALLSIWYRNRYLHSAHRIWIGRAYECYHSHRSPNNKSGPKLNVTSNYSSRLINEMGKLTFEYLIYEGRFEALKDSMGHI